MNAIDIVILIPLVWGFWRGFMKGAIMEAATFAAFFLGVWGGMHLSDGVSELLRHWTNSSSKYIPLISFALVFVVIMIVVFAAGKLVERVVKSVALGIVNKLAGAVIGMMKYLLLLSILFFVMDAVEKNIEIIPRSMKDKSLLYRPVSGIAPAIIPGLKGTGLGVMRMQSDSTKNSSAH